MKTDVTSPDAIASAYRGAPPASSPSGREVSLPSRFDNPFSTCWTRPGALAYHFFDSELDEARLIERLRAHDWRGEIRGPHGSGKSTLLATLIPHLEAAGRHVISITLRDGERRLPRSTWHSHSPPTDAPSHPITRQHSAPRRSILIIDGYEQLATMERILVSRRCRRRKMGLLVTSHTPTKLPLLIELQPTLDHVAALASVLCAHRDFQISFDDITSSHARCGGNVREIFFELYDRYEAQRRSVNSLDARNVP